MLVIVQIQGKFFRICTIYIYLFKFKWVNKFDKISKYLPLLFGILDTRSRKLKIIINNCIVYIQNIQDIQNNTNEFNENYCSEFTSYLRGILHFQDDEGNSKYWREILEKSRKTSTVIKRIQSSLVRTRLNSICSRENHDKAIKE